MAHSTYIIYFIVHHFLSLPAQKSSLIYQLQKFPIPLNPPISYLYGNPSYWQTFGDSKQRGGERGNQRNLGILPQWASKTRAPRNAIGAQRANYHIEHTYVHNAHTG